MTIRLFTITLCLAALGAGAVFAQQPASTPRPQRPPTTSVQPAPPGAPSIAPPPPPPAPPAPPAPRREGQPINVKVDVTITDQRSGAAPSKKTVSIVTADGMTGSIRYVANYFNLGQLPLNVDTEPQVLADGKVRLRVNLQYELPASSGDVGRGEAGSIAKTAIHENLSLILDNGKSMVAAQSADPTGDRQVTIEVKATVLR